MKLIIEIIYNNKWIKDAIFEQHMTITLACSACLMLHPHVGGAVEQLSQKCTRAAQARNWQNKIRPICQSVMSANPTQRSNTGKSLVPSSQSCCSRLVSNLLNHIIWSLFYCKTDENREELGRPDTSGSIYTIS